MNKLIRMVIATGFALALSVGVLAVFTEDAHARRGPCICPQIYAPVECKGGKVFPNQCVADCRHAKDCVPIGIL